jgi:ribosome-associated translation inhibitor RaiA
MQKPLQITLRGLDHSEAIEAKIRDKALGLERFSRHVTGCHVTVHAPPAHQHKGGTYAVNVDLRVPSGELVVSRERGLNHAHEDLSVALRDAFNAAIRQLEDYVRRQRSQLKRRTG